MMSYSSVCPVSHHIKTCQADNVDQLKPISSAYARYAPEATFHDPIGLANGLEAVVSTAFVYDLAYMLT